MNNLTISDVKEIISGNFKDCADGLNAISEVTDDTGNKKPLLDYPDRFYNYDTIAGKLYKQRPKSPDMVLFKDDSVIFVEFKSGRVKAGDVKLKAVEGCFIILHEIVSTYKKDIDFLDIVKLKKWYILVYEKDKNHRKGMYDFHYANKARFGLEMYKGTFFYNVETWRPGKFVKWLRENRFIGGGNGGI